MQLHSNNWALFHWKMSNHPKNRKTGVFQFMKKVSICSFCRKVAFMHANSVLVVNPALLKSELWKLTNEKISLKLPSWSCCFSSFKVKQSWINLSRTQILRTFTFRINFPANAQTTEIEKHSLSKTVLKFSSLSTLRHRVFVVVDMAFVMICS